MSEFDARSSDAPLVYLIYGIPGSGRREVIFDLIQGGLKSGGSVLYFRPESETPSPFDEQIEAIGEVVVVNWRLSGNTIKHDAIHSEPETIFILAPGDGDPVDVAEALRTWTEHNSCEVGRILTVLHCGFLKETPQAQAWFDGCIHFSDIVLLNRREAAGNKWVKDFEEGYRKRCFPCRFLMVKKGRVDNPHEVLEPEARRVSLYFDQLIPIEDDEFEDGLPEDQKPDKYIERLESGQRAHPIPDIRKLLG